jgi:DNA polymerase-3 subunit alpha
MPSNFIHLRVHTKYSIGEGTLYIENNEKKDPGRSSIVKLCKQHGMPACAVTDTNLMSGAAEMSDVLPESGIQPIIGISTTFNHHDTADPKILRSEMLSNIVLLAISAKGYENLCVLNSMMYMRQDNRHLGAYIDWAELESHSEGLICLSGGHIGPVGMALLQDQDDLAKSYATRMQKLFGDRFYMEIMRHGLNSQIKTEEPMLRIAADLDIPIVATNDVCFAGPENYEAADALSCVLQQTKIIDPERLRKNSEQYFKSPAEMAELFSDLPEAIENTIAIAKRCAFHVDTHSKPLLPRFGDDFETECKMLHDDSAVGLKKRMEECEIPEAEQQQYFDQLEFEVGVINNMGFPGYFLIVADYIDWSRNNGILVGPGRGSGAGSVVAWALGITNVNPLEYGLLFERFLNPDRISMPDFDVDFEPEGVPKVLDYICQKYGADHICRIITFGSLQARGAIRDIGRVFGMPYSKSDRFSKLIPADAKKIADAVRKSDDIQEILDEDNDMKKVVDVSMEIEGAYRNLGQHACGVVIGDRPTIRIAPVYRDPSNEMPSCQYDGHFLEGVGLIKFDFLGLETLTVLKNTCELIRKTNGEHIDLDKIPMEDEKTFELWRAGKTAGVFQYDGSARPFLPQMKPTKFANIVALNALNRPGPMAYIPQYIARMHGEEPVTYLHEKAEEILGETYGIIVYQEQVMQLSRALAGFTRGESDTLRKGMGKKIKEVMDKMRVKFVEGCEREKTLSRDAAEELYQHFIKFAEYAFNKSHSVAYSVIAAQCAYLKAHYPAEFLAASMSSNMGNSDQLAIFIDDAKNNFNINIVPPDINKSESLFSVQKEKILFGLAAIKGVGLAAIDQIVAIRNADGKFKNITDFATRTAGILNKKILEALAKTGALDSIAPSRSKIFMNADAILIYGMKQKNSAQTLSLFENTDQNDVDEDRLWKNMADVPEWNFGEKMAHELSALGFYISAHPMDVYKTLIKKTGIATSESMQRMADRKPVQIAASVNSYSKRMTKTGKLMCGVNAADSYGNIDAVAFGELANDIARTLESEKMVLISGKLSSRDERISIFIDSVQPLGQWVANVARKLNITVYDRMILPDLKKILDGLSNGSTRVFINLSDGEKTTTLALPNVVRLTNTILSDLSSIGVKAEIE